MFHMMHQGSPSISPHDEATITGPMLNLLLLLALLSCASAQRLSSRSDLAALYSLRASLGLRARDWPLRADPCAAWVGVRCRAGRVVSLDLSGLRRTRRSRLSPRFDVDGVQNLTALASLNASGFALPGPIPDWFGRGLPATLSVLDLRSAAITGPIPYSLGGATGLRELYLSRNSITGDIPPTLGQLSNLSMLDLSDNALTGSIPPSLGSLGHLSALGLSSNFLYGSIPSTLGSLRSLRTLNLSNNNLFGSIPVELGKLSVLVSLDLSFNKLVGTLPDELKDLRSLHKLDLGHNLFSGSLPGNLFFSFSQLQFITLSHNNFSGPLPDSLWSTMKLVLLDASYNNLTGTLPNLVPANANSNGSASGSVFNLSNNLYYGTIPSEFQVFFHRFNPVDISANYFQGAISFGGKNGNVSFEANCFRNASKQRNVVGCKKFYTERGIPYDGPLAPSPPLPPSSSGRKHNKGLKYILAGVFGGLGVVIVVASVLVLCLMRHRACAANRRESSVNIIPSANGRTSVNAIPSANGVPSIGVSVNVAAVGDSFTYEHLLKATSGFSSSNLIKDGHSGKLYHGVLEGEVHVVVKRIDVQRVEKDAYFVELDLFSQVSHMKLVPFVGHCLDNENEKLFVYKYMPNGDLSKALYRERGQGEEGLQSLDWITRLKIATGVAEALCFLHHECNPPRVHRDVQASSILIDDKFEVRIGSLSKVCTQEGDGHHGVITRLLPSSQMSKQGISASPPATCAYDVYCLGKVLLELVTGKLGISASNDTATNEWLEHTLPYINIYEKELMMEIVDPSLIVDDDLLEEVWAMAVVAKSCLNPRPSKRPLMRHIFKALENPLKVVRVENNSTSSRHRATSSWGSWNNAFFNSWWCSSSDAASLGRPREDQSIRRSSTTRSQGSRGEHSFSHKKHSSEIFPEPFSMADDTED